jgi:hypothetical protein
MRSDRARTHMPGLVFPHCSLRIWLRARHTSGEETLGHASRLSCRKPAVSLAPLRKACA